MRRLPKRSGTSKIPRADFVIPRERGQQFVVVIDSHAKLAWTGRELDGEPLIVVLAADAPDSYLKMLREREISYIFAGKKGGDIDLATVLEKLAGKFGIRKLLLEGGGETNGSFLRDGLVDELSLLLTPVADGRQGEPALFDVEGKAPAKAVARLRLKSVRRVAADMLWIKDAVRNSGG